MSAPGISVIVPTYDCARYIATCIDSVIAQTRPADEILVVDDGSTDDTPSIVTSYRDPRIRYIRMPHRGTAAARNRGIELARGRYLAFLDADDVWRPAMLERQVSVMEADPRLVCCFTNFMRFKDATGEPMAEQFDYYPELARLPVTACAGTAALVLEGDAFTGLIGFEDIPAFMQCMLFRRALISDMRLNESLKRCQDLEFVARVFMRGKVAFTREVLTDVRRHDGNATRDISLMALDKLRALVPLRNAVDTPARRAALEQRLVKAWIDAATTLIRSGRRWDGMRHFAQALALPGSLVRKLKGMARVGYELAASLTARAPAVARATAKSSKASGVPWPPGRRR